MRWNPSFTPGPFVNCSLIQKMDREGKAAWLLCDPDDRFIRWVIFAKPLFRPLFRSEHDKIELWSWDQSNGKPAMLLCELTHARSRWQELTDVGYSIGGMTAAAEV